MSERILSPLRSQIDGTLETLVAEGIIPDATMRANLVEVLSIAYKDATPNEWQDVAERFHRATGLSELAAKALLSGQESAAVEVALAERPSIETLVADGWFAKYLEYVAESEAPTSFHFGAALTCCAAGLGRQPLLSWEARPTYPNLYTLLIGPSGARKGSALVLAQDITAVAMDINMLPNEGTHQGYAAALKRRFLKTQVWSDGLILIPEFSVLMKKDRHKEGLVQWLTDWYDSPNYWARALRGEEHYELYNLCVSMLGASNMPWLRTLPEEAITGGYFPRHLIFDAVGRRHWKARPKFNPKLREELIADINTRVGNIPDTLSFDPATAKYLDTWYEIEIRASYNKTNDEQIQAWLDRKQAAALKVAMTWQMMDGGPKDALHKEWLHKARRIVDWQDNCVAKVYASMGTTQEGEIPVAIMQLLAKSGGRMVAAVIWRTLRNKYKSGRVKEALETLSRSGEVKMTGNAIEGIVVEMVNK